MNDRDLYVDGAAALSAFLDEIEAEALLAIDTEFVREKTYFPQLCLLQIASSGLIGCVDCLAIADMRPLFEHLLRPECCWILHSSRQDLEVIYQHTDRLPGRLIDTQVAAGLAGYAPQIGLQELAADLLGIRLDKDYTRTDWSRRPLPRAALTYAYDDVRSLTALWKTLERRLQALGRLEWAQQDFALQLRSAPVTPTASIWARLKGLRSLDSRQRAAALGLVDWRETRARQRNRPRRWILSDDALLEIAAALPDSPRALAAVPGLPPRLTERCGKELVAAVRTGADDESRGLADELFVVERPDRQRLRELQAGVQARAAELGIQPEVLATRQELTDLLTRRPAPRISQTWRSAELRDLLPVET
jgi:ribonuclease D